MPPCSCSTCAPPPPTAAWPRDLAEASRRVGRRLLVRHMPTRSVSPRPYRLCGGRDAAHGRWPVGARAARTRALATSELVFVLALVAAMVIAEMRSTDPAAAPLGEGVAGSWQGVLRAFRRSNWQRRRAFEAGKGPGRSRRLGRRAPPGAHRAGQWGCRRWSWPGSEALDRPAQPYQRDLAASAGRARARGPASSPLEVRTSTALTRRWRFRRCGGGPSDGGEGRAADAGGCCPADPIGASAIARRWSLAIGSTSAHNVHLRAFLRTDAPRGGTFVCVADTNREVRPGRRQGPPISIFAGPCCSHPWPLLRSIRFVPSCQGARGTNTSSGCARCLLEKMVEVGSRGLEAARRWGAERCRRPPK